MEVFPCPQLVQRPLLGRAVGEEGGGRHARVRWIGRHVMKPDWMASPDSPDPTYQPGRHTSLCISPPLPFGGSSTQESGSVQGSMAMAGYHRRSPSLEPPPPPSDYHGPAILGTQIVGSQTPPPFQSFPGPRASTPRGSMYRPQVPGPRCPASARCAGPGRVESAELWEQRGRAHGVRRPPGAGPAPGRGAHAAPPAPVEHVFPVGARLHTPSSPATPGGGGRGSGHVPVSARHSRRCHPDIPCGQGCGGCVGGGHRRAAPGAPHGIAGEARGGGGLDWIGLDWIGASLFPGGQSRGHRSRGPWDL